MQKRQKKTKKTKRQKDKKSKRQKDKKTKKTKRQKDKKTKNKKRVYYCDVRAVSHSCDVYIADAASFFQDLFNLFLSVL